MSFGVEDSDFARDLGDSKSTSGATLHIWEPHICSSKLDVQGTDMCVIQLDKIRNYFS